VTRDVIRARLNGGSWQRIHTGVYATFSGEPGRPALLWAAVLRGGSGAALSYQTAAELHGLIRSPASLIHVTVPADRYLEHVRGLVIHYSNRAEVARHPVLLPPRTRVEETALDLAAAALCFDDALGWVSAACAGRLTTPARIQAAMAERAVNLNVNSAQGWFVLGAGAMYLGDHARALDCEARALRLNPAGPLRVQAMSIMAMSHFLLGQHNEAHVWAERAYQENPNFTVVIRALVLSSVAVGNLPRARMAFERFATDLPKQLELTKRMMKRPEDFEKFSSAMRTASSFG
jgi:tetratricopeptide (TPR) repeat protein